MKPVIALACAVLVLAVAMSLWRASAPDVPMPGVERIDPEIVNSDTSGSDVEQIDSVNRQDAVARPLDDDLTEGDARRVRFVSAEKPVVMPDLCELAVGDSVSNLGQVAEFPLPPHTSAGTPVQVSWRGRVLGRTEVALSSTTTLEVSPCAFVEFEMADSEPCALLWASDASVPRYDIELNEISSKDGRISGFLPAATEIRIAVQWDTGETMALGLLTLAPWQVHQRPLERPPHLFSVSGVVTDTYGEPVPALPIRVSRAYPRNKQATDFMILQAPSTILFGGFSLDTVTDDSGHFMIRHFDASTHFPVFVQVRSRSGYVAAQFPNNGNGWSHRGDSFIPYVVKKFER